MSSEQISDHELVGFRKNFDREIEDFRKQIQSLNKALDELKQEQKRNASELDSQIVDEVSGLKKEIESISSNLESSKAVHETFFTSTVEMLKKDQERISTKFNKDWNKPRLAFSLVITLAAVLFGFGIFKELTLVNELKRRSDDLKATNTESRKFLSNTQTQLAEAKTKSDAALVESQNELNALGKEKEFIKGFVSSSREELQNINKQSTEHIDKQMVPLRNELKIARDTFRAGIVAESVALRASANATLARDQLISRGDAARALHYVKQAKTVLASAQPQLNQLAVGLEDPELAKVLDRILPLVLQIEAEIYVTTGKYDELLAVSCEILNHCKKCPEGEYFRGLANLNLAVRQSDKKTRVELARGAISSFVTAKSGGNSAKLTDVYLALARIEAGEFQSAITTTSAFVNSQSNDKTKRKQLSLSAQASLFLAESFQNLTRFIQREQDALERPVCSLLPGALTEHDAIMVEAVLDRILENRLKFAKDDKIRAEELGKYCVFLIGNVRLACENGGGSCPNCGGDRSGCGG